MIIGHRGAAGLAPENTIAAIQKALDSGTDWIEIDTQLTADKVPVVFHDETLDRCTDGSGKVQDIAFADLQRLDAGGWFSSDFSGERVPSLQEVLAFCAENGVGINLELKIHHSGQEKELAEKVTETIASTGFPAEQLILSSFSKEALRYCRTLMPHIRAGYITEETPEEYLNEVAGLDLFSIHADHAVLTPEIAGQIRERGYVLNIWTMNDVEKRKTFEDMGVSNIITDYPSRF